MNKKHTKGIALVFLSVCLLFVISSRTDAGEGLISSSLRDDEVTETFEPLSTETPEVTEEPVPSEPVKDWPDLSMSDWQYKIINNIQVVTASFVPNVAATENGQYFDERAVENLAELLDAARAAGHEVYVSNAYRPYGTQAYIFFGRASIISESQGIEYAKAEMLAREIVAYPGTSDHQTALGVDLLTSADMSLIAEDVEDAELFKWLNEHCAEYGFIPRYPKDKKDITGWYEPWHFRYVGKEAAEYIVKKGICLEEFVQLYA